MFFSSENCDINRVFFFRIAWTYFYSILRMCLNICFRIAVVFNKYLAENLHSLDFFGSGFNFNV